MGGGDRWGRGGFEARPQLSAKKVQVFFLLSFDSEHFKTCKYTKKKFIWVYPPPPPNQPNPCVLVAYLDTLIVCVIGAPVTGGPWADSKKGFVVTFSFKSAAIPRIWPIRVQHCLYSFTSQLFLNPPYVSVWSRGRNPQSGGRISALWRRSFS